MKMKIATIEKNYYGFHLKGSRVLKLMMDNETPHIDLLVRESIQNSADATRDDRNYCSISFKMCEFDNYELAFSLEGVDESLYERYGCTSRKALAIIDRNTTGLLGEPYEDKNNHNNLYKLVYSFLESDKDDVSGGSWGIGKSVYYRFGIGLVFYYSRTYEHGKYCHKLAGAIIENEESEHALLKKNPNNLGIAFFGNELRSGNSVRSIPIVDEKCITDFLNIFGLSPFQNDETGTMVLIPYFSEANILMIRSSEENAYWENSFELSLSVSVQRWYFPRLNNREYKGKYIRVRINETPIELNPFFSVMQNLYNGTVEDAFRLDVNASNFHGFLGSFFYKKFTQEELKVMVPPDNLPSPYALLDIRTNSESVDNEAIVFYTRKPGMIVTYDDTRTFTTLKTPPNEYIIGVFVLNDDSSYKNEKIGMYFKECEKANHKSWNDYSASTKIKEIINLKSKPFKTIKNQISKKLSLQFDQPIPEEVVTKNSALQKKLGELLLPPEDFGEEPTTKRKKPKEKPPLIEMKKEKRIVTYFNGFFDGRPSYTFQAYLKSGEQFICRIMVKTASVKYQLNEWDDFDFTLPCYFRSLQIDGYILKKMNFNLLLKLDFTRENFTKGFVKNDGNKERIFHLATVLTPKTNKVGGFVLRNYSSEELRMTINTFLEPLDETTEFVFSNTLSRMGGTVNGG